MSLLQAILLGIIQGLTEFLPISSSAHLVLIPFLLGWKLPAEQAFIFNVLVQDGTLLAVIIYYWKDLVSILVSFVRCLFRGKPFSEPEARLGWYLILATIPAGLLGLLIKSQVEAAFNSPAVTSIFLFVTAGLLFLGEVAGKRIRSLSSLGWLDALFVGLFQAVSLFPGISRSGSTLTGGMLRNFDRPAAARFAFLMSVPVMQAVGVLEGIELAQSPNLGSLLPVVIVGMLISAVVGYLAIRWMIGYLMRHTLKVFALYCIALGVVTLIVAYVRG